MLHFLIGFLATHPGKIIYAEMITHRRGKEWTATSM